MNRWSVWRVDYATYAEIDARGGPEKGDIKPVCVARGLSFEAGRKMVDALGFGHSMHPDG